MMTFETFSLFPEQQFRPLRLLVGIHLCLQLCLSAADLARAIQVLVRGYGNPSMLIATGLDMCFVLLFSVLIHTQAQGYLLWKAFQCSAPSACAPTMLQTRRIWKLCAFGLLFVISVLAAVAGLVMARCDMSCLPPLKRS